MYYRSSNLAARIFHRQICSPAPGTSVIYSCCPLFLRPFLLAILTTLAFFSSLSGEIISADKRLRILTTFMLSCIGLQAL